MLFKVTHCAGRISANSMQTVYLIFRTCLQRGREKKKSKGKNGYMYHSPWASILETVWFYKCTCQLFVITKRMNFHKGFDPLPLNFEVQRPQISALVFLWIFGVKHPQAIHTVKAELTFVPLHSNPLPRTSLLPRLVSQSTQKYTITTRKHVIIPNLIKCYVFTGHFCYY